MKVQRYGFYGKLKEQFSKLREVPATMQASMIFLAVLCLAMSLMVLPSVRARLLQPANQALQQGQKYSEKVLSENRATPAEHLAGLEK